MRRNGSRGLGVTDERDAPGRAAGARSRSCWVGAAVVVVAIVLAAVVVSQPRSGGPLEIGFESGVVVSAFPAGSTVTYGLQTLGNVGDQPIELVSIEPALGDPRPTITGEVMLLGPERVDLLGYGVFDVAGWPAVDVPLTPVVGQVLPAHSTSHVEVVVPLTVPESGLVVIEGFVVTYRVAGRSYRATSSTMLVLCPFEDLRACEQFEAEL